MCFGHLLCPSSGVFYCAFGIGEFRALMTQLGSGHHKLHETYQCRMYSRKLLMMGREDDRNMYSFIKE